MNEECRSGREAVTSRGHRLVASSRQLFSSSFFVLPTKSPFFSPLSPAIDVLFCACGGFALAGGLPQGGGKENVGTG